MAFADANQSSIRVVEETSWGTVPSGGSSREVRLTSSGLSAQKETVVSDELRADRMVGSITEVAATSSGDINFEFSAGAVDEFLAAFVMGYWTRPMTLDFWKGRNISVTGVSEITYAGTDISAYLSAGRRIKLAGFTNPANNGYLQIASVAVAGSNTVITVTANSLVVEAGTVAARLYDANDVIVLNDTSITATASGFSGNATNPFAAAVAAGQLAVGQKVAVVGLGLEVGTIAAAGVLSTLVVTVSDGVNSATLTAGTDFAVGVDDETDTEALAAAINALRVRSNLPVNVKAVANTGTITITNLNKVGGAITEDTVDVNATVTNFAGGVAGATGVFTLLSVSDDLLVTSPAPAVAAAQSVTIKGSMLRNPSDVAEITQRSFAIETGFNNVSQFMVQDGMVPGTFSMEIATGAIITGTVGFEGRATELVQSTVLGNAANFDVLEAPAGEVANATTNVGDVTKDGSDFSACIQSISISGEANLRQQACVGSKFSRGIGAGRFNLTGSMAVYFEDETLFNDFIEHQTVALSWSITDAEGTAYHFTIPATKFSQDEIAPGGIDQDVIENMEWTAFRDATTGCMFQVDRFSPSAEV